MTTNNKVICLYGTQCNFYPNCNKVHLIAMCKNKQCEYYPKCKYSHNKDWSMYMEYKRNQRYYHIISKFCYDNKISTNNDINILYVSATDDCTADREIKWNMYSIHRIFINLVKY